MKCTICHGEMLPEWAPFKRCPTCRETITLRSQKRRARPEVVLLERKNRRNFYARHREQELRSQSEARAAKKQRGVCQWCPETVADDSDWCAVHRDAHRESARLSWRRRKSKRPEWRAA